MDHRTTEHASLLRSFNLSKVPKVSRFEQFRFQGGPIALQANYSPTLHLLSGLARLAIGIQSNFTLRLPATRTRAIQMREIILKALQTLAAPSRAGILELWRWRDSAKYLEQVDLMHLQSCGRRAIDLSYQNSSAARRSVSQLKIDRTASGSPRFLGQFNAITQRDGRSIRRFTFSAEERLMEDDSCESRRAIQSPTFQFQFERKDAFSLLTTFTTQQQLRTRRYA